MFFMMVFLVVFVATGFATTTTVLSQSILPRSSLSQSIGTTATDRDEDRDGHRYRDRDTNREAARRHLAEQAAVWEARDNVLRQAAEMVLPSVVHIETVHSERDTSTTGRSRRIEETGSGVLMEWDGKFYVLTNFHVVADVRLQSVQVFLKDGTLLPLKQILTNSEYDLALLEIATSQAVPHLGALPLSHPLPPLVAAVIGDSDMVDVADTVLVLGSPFGLRHSVTVGVISAKERTRLPLTNKPNPLLPYFQTDATINPGNSGGPLVNMRGEVIGIVSAIASTTGTHEGVGFAIPIVPFARAAKQLATTGRVTRPYIGVELDAKWTVETATASGTDSRLGGGPHGARVVRVLAESPAATAGIRTGDILVSYNNVRIEDDLHFISLVARSVPGDTPTISLLRNNTPQTVTPLLSPQESR